MLRTVCLKRNVFLWLTIVLFLFTVFWWAALGSSHYIMYTSANSAAIWGSGSAKNTLTGKDCSTITEKNLALASNNLKLKNHLRNLEAEMVRSPSVQTPVDSASLTQRVSRDARFDDYFYDLIDRGPGFSLDFEDSRELQVTYESCLESLGTAERPKSFPGEMHWLHMPKTGTSFGATLYGHLCTATPNPKMSPTGVNCTYCANNWLGKRKVFRGWEPKLNDIVPYAEMPYCDWSVAKLPAYHMQNHQPLWFDFPEYVRRYPKARIVSMFRDPRRRIVSAWNHDGGKHAYGIEPKDRPRIDGHQTIAEYAVDPVIQSCQAKMVAGENCGKEMRISRELFREIKRRVANFDFVGITDAFNASVCLFHHMYGGSPKPWMFASLRTSAELNQKEELIGGGKRVPSSSYRQIPIEADPVDWALYLYARELFAAKLQKYGIWQPDLKLMKRKSLPLKKSM